MASPEIYSGTIEQRQKTARKLAKLLFRVDFEKFAKDSPEEAYRGRSISLPPWSNGYRRTIDFVETHDAFTAIYNSRTPKKGILKTSRAIRLSKDSSEELVLPSNESGIDNLDFARGMNPGISPNEHDAKSWQGIIEEAVAVVKSEAN